jgi:hypothetical protein
MLFGRTPNIEHQILAREGVRHHAAEACSDGPKLQSALLKPRLDNKPPAIDRVRKLRTLPSFSPLGYSSPSCGRIHKSTACETRMLTSFGVQISHLYSFRLAYVTGMESPPSRSWVFVPSVKYVTKFMEKSSSKRERVMAWRDDGGNRVKAHTYK